MSTKEAVIQRIQQLPDSASIEQIIAALCDHDQTHVTARPNAQEDMDAFIGVWANRRDLTDSCDAVRKEREQWQQRLTRQA